MKDPTLKELEERARRRKDKPALRLIAAIKKRDKKHKNKLHTGLDVPKIGEDIYIEGSMYIDHGEDDIAGGLGEVSKVTKEMSGGNAKTPFIEIKEVPGRVYNWETLGPLQKELKKEYKKQRAHPDPDVG